MKAISLEGIHLLGTIDCEEAIVKRPDDVRIKIKSVGVCGSDIHYYRDGKIGVQVVKYPFVIGHEFSGVVEAIGSGVSRLKVGDRVSVDPSVSCGTCDQCLAGRPHTCRNNKFLGCPGQLEGCNKPYIVMPERNCYLLPDPLSFDEGMLVEPLSIGIYSTLSAGDVAGKHIGILGFGPIGMCVFQSLKMRGAASVFVSEPLANRRALALAQGADMVVNPLTEDVISVFNNALPLQQDIVFDCCGMQQAADQAINTLKPGGTFMIIGIPEFDNWAFQADLMRRKEITIKNVRRQNHCDQAAIDAISSGNVSMEGMISHRFHWSEAQKAYDIVANYRDNVMKVVLYFDE